MVGEQDRETEAGEGETEVSSTSDYDPQLTFIRELLAEDATVAGDVLEIDEHTWAIHGTIALDGDVIMAEYDTEAHAHIVLDELSSPPSEMPDRPR